MDNYVFDEHDQVVGMESWMYLKKDFGKLKTYKEKLVWWDKMVLSKIFGTPYIIFAPIKSQSYEYVIKEYEYSNELSCIVDSSYTISGPDYLSIIPFFDDEKVSFFEWLISKDKDITIEYFESNYIQRISKIDLVNLNEAIGKFKNELFNIEINNHPNIYFDHGIDYAIFYESEFKDFGGNTRYIKNFKFLTDSFLKGFKFKLKETALKNILKKMEPDIIEQPNEQNKIGTITKQQAVLIFDFIFSELDADNNATKRSEFISFLTGLPTEGLRKKHSGKGLNSIEDLKIIRPYFENLKLQTIVKKINKEINNEV